MENSPFKKFFKLRNGVPFPAIGQSPPPPFTTWDPVLWGTTVDYLDAIAEKLGIIVVDFSKP